MTDDTRPAQPDSLGAISAEMRAWGSTSRWQGEAIPAIEAWADRLAHVQAAQALTPGEVTAEATQPDQHFEQLLGALADIEPSLDWHEGYRTGYEEALRREAAQAQEGKPRGCDMCGEHRGLLWCLNCINATAPGATP